MVNRNILLELAKTSMDETPFDNPNFPPSPYYRFLKNLAKLIEPWLSVELGVCGGGGCLHLCQGFPDGMVVGVDYTNDYPNNIEFIEKSYPNFRFLKDDSVLAASKIHKMFGEVDILFIDTIHTYERTMVEYNAWYPYLSKQAIVCFDDLHRKEMSLGGKNVWEYIGKQGQTLRLDFLHHSELGEGGFGILWGIRR